MPRRRDVPVEAPKPGESPLRRNPRTRLLNHARDEAGLYDGRAAEPSHEQGHTDEVTNRSRRFSPKITGRSVRLAVNVQEKTRGRLRQLAERERITMGELIERAVEVYEKGSRQE
jgi:hypothetical protein